MAERFIIYPIGDYSFEVTLLNDRVFSLSSIGDSTFSVLPDDRVFSVSPIGDAVFSATALDGVVVEPQVPDGSCVNLVSTVVDDDVTLFWENESTNETSIRVYRSTDGILFTEIETLLPGIESFEDWDLEDGTYYYKVRAERNGYFSSYSNVDEVEISTVPPYEAETISLLAAMDIQPTTALADLINTTIKGLKDDQVWSELVMLKVRAVHSAQAGCLNWVGRYSDSTLVNAPTFTPKKGFKGDGTNYINLNIILKNIAGLNQDITVFQRHSQMGTVTARAAWGQRKSTAPTSQCYLLIYTAGNERGYINGTTYHNNSNIDANQLHTYTKNGVSCRAFVDGAYVGAADINTQTELPSTNLFELAYNNDGIANNAYNGETNVFGVGKLLSDDLVLKLHNRIKYFFDNVNATF